MVDIKKLIENPDKFRKGCTWKNIDPVYVDDVIAINEGKMSLLRKVQDLRTLKNELAKSRDIENGKKAKQGLKVYEPKLKKAEEDFTKAIKLIPNPPADDVHHGKDEKDNIILRQWNPPKYRWLSRPVYEFRLSLSNRMYKIVDKVRPV